MQTSGYLMKDYLDNPVLNKASGHGIKVDTVSPTFGWVDVIGDVRPKTSGAGTPALTLYRGSIYSYAFVLNDLCDFVYHIPHDYVPGSDLMLHVHHGHNGTDITGNAVWTFYAAYGSRDGVYGSEISNTISYNTVSLATTPQYMQLVTEVQLSNIGGDATHLNTSAIEVDGLIKIRLKLTTIPTVTAGSWFLDTADIHMQSTGIGTKNSASPFYG